MDKMKYLWQDKYFMKSMKYYGKDKYFMLSMKYLKNISPKIRNSWGQKKYEQFFLVLRNSKFSVKIGKVQNVKLHNNLKQLNSKEVLAKVRHLVSPEAKKKKKIFTFPKLNCVFCVSHYSKSQFFVQKFNFDKTPTFWRVFHPKFFLIIFLVK